MLRFGLVGTGYWARAVHGRALADSSEVELVGVWGRDGGRTATTAAELGTKAFGELDELLGVVDGLAFAVPPHVQAPIATEAARLGKHLLLEKPTAISTAEAEALADAAEKAGVATVVFFTWRFMPAVRDWLAEVSRLGWQGGWARFVGAAFAPGSPFDTPWRSEKGGLWDLGPHALAVLVGALGRVTAVDAAAGLGDYVDLVLAHESGASSSSTLTISAPKAGENEEVGLWGEAGRTLMPNPPRDNPVLSGIALHELVVAAESGTSHPLGARFGADVVAVLAEAERRLAAAGPQPAGG